MKYWLQSWVTIMTYVAFSFLNIFYDDDWLVGMLRVGNNDDVDHLQVVDGWGFSYFHVIFLSFQFYFVMSLHLLKIFFSWTSFYYLKFIYKFICLYIVKVIHSLFCQSVSHSMSKTQHALYFKCLVGKSVILYI